MPLFFTVESLILHYSYNNSNNQALEPKIYAAVNPPSTTNAVVAKKIVIAIFLKLGPKAFLHVILL